MTRAEPAGLTGRQEVGGVEQEKYSTLSVSPPVLGRTERLARSLMCLLERKLGVNMRNLYGFFSPRLTGWQKVRGRYRKFRLPEGEEKSSPDFLRGRQDWGGFGVGLTGKSGFLPLRQMAMMGKYQKIIFRQEG